MARELRAALIAAGVDADRALAVLRPARLPAAPAPPPNWRARVATIVGLQLGQDLAGTGAWALLGAASVRGTVDAGLVAGWALLVLTALGLRLSAAADTTTLAVAAGAALRRRILAGALAREPRTVAMEGIGTLLARANEAQRLETLGLGAGAGAILAAGELVLAAGILIATSPGLAALLVGVPAAAALQVARLAHHTRAATTARRRLGHVVTEELLGHRTRLVQCPPARVHEAEVPAVDAHLVAQAAVDDAAIALSPTLARAWLVLALVGLLFSGAPALAALGGVLLAWRALERVSAAGAEIVAVVVAWEQVRALWSVPEAGAGADPGPGDLRARGLAFGWGATETLRDVDLDIPAGARVLLQGASGAGKSTLALLLAGILKPSRGALLAGGLDRATLGAAGWRDRVVAAPQFHQNHVFYGSFAFNLLLGRRWPATEEDLTRAASLCRELGLGPLIDRMPAGLAEVVGETGWQLSHGERSRLYLARALLRGAPVVVLDESFGALDPATLQLAVEAARRHATTLVVVAHP